MKDKQSIKERFKALKARALKVWDYWSVGVWSDTRGGWWINTVKTINLSVRSFLNRNLQGQSLSMAYRTMLALVPALALLFAIGRGFGFQTLLQDELFTLVPGQKTAVTESLKFVDSYLNRASEGAFVGIGLVFLLWTIISLLSSVESSFNMIWGIRQGRSFIRKLTDYTAMLLILPILMICAGGLTIFLSSTLQSITHFSFMTPLVSIFLKFASWILTWLFFGAVYILIPNTKVKIQNALIAGIFAGTGFMILQWLFVSGQVYVTRYNAIYGSFAFVPLLLIWLQLTWLVILSGAVLCYSSQNIFQFSFNSEIAKISAVYRNKVTLAVASVVARRFVNQQEPPTRQSIALEYGIPSRLVADILDRLVEARLINQVILNSNSEVPGYQPAMDPDELTVELVFNRLSNMGKSNFIPDFNTRFEGIEELMSKIQIDLDKDTNQTRISDLTINELTAEKS